MISVQLSALFLDGKLKFSANIKGGYFMQIYFSSHDAALITMIQNALQQQDLSESVRCVQLPNPQENMRFFDAETVNLTTVLVTALSAGGAGTVLVHKLAKVLETLINSKKVEAKIQDGQKIIELSGSAGHIEKMLKTIMDAKQE